MSSQYKGLEFKTRLEAKWAAFFDLAGWSWWVNPIAIDDWRPDFKVAFKCDHSECNGQHSLLIAILPMSDIKKFNGHPCLSYVYDITDENGQWQADGGAAFGNNPSVSQWEILHGSGGGTEDVYFRVGNADELWIQAEALVK